MQNGQKGFTLAEVLITLAIIGVVAALTIPTLVNNYQKSQYIAALKKAYTQFNQAMGLLVNEAGCNGDLKCTGLFSAPNVNNLAFGDEMVKYIKPLKVCGLAVNQGCWAVKMNANFDGSSATNYQYDNLASGYKFISADGVSFLIGTFRADCSAAGSSNQTTGNMNQVCARVYIDVNGPAKGPNNMGRDIFPFWVTNGKGAVLYPEGGSDDHYLGGKYWWKEWTPNGCSTDGAVGSTYRGGVYCSGRVMEESWQMNY